MKIVSLCPSNTELVEALGLTESLIAVDDYSDFPESVRTLPKLGPDLSINIDLVESLQPDLVLSSLSVPGMEKNIEELDRRGIPHTIFNPQSIADMKEDLLTLGKLTGAEERALKVCQDIEDVLTECKRISAQLTEKPSLYWEWWPNPIFTPGSVNWLTEISELAGASNVFQDVGLASVQTDWNDVCLRNPDHICLAWVGVQTSRVNPAVIKKRPGSSELDAVKENRIHILEEELYCRPSPRLIEGLIKLGKLLHPEAYDHLESPY
ncbi:ABC transporter substrate-binding protein [Jeotgalibacillus aurantiacus]|uniref:ABC transporter substrate-binding protein n=1 Tax=Jeotgalibacillus aurantiacus TaxID=2763266 RepID=UPI001D0AE598|nr:cobalamin-binding protein [Jeotgalibacillus aurantiacus]